MFIGELLQVTLFIVFFLLTANFSNYAKFFVSYFLANYSNLGNADLYLTANFSNYANFLSTLFYYSNLLNNYSNLPLPLTAFLLTANFSNYANFLSTLFYYSNLLNNYSNLNNADLYLTANFSNYTNFLSLTFWRITRIWTTRIFI